MLGTGVGSELRHPLGIDDGRRPAREPGADAVHDAGDLPCVRPPRATRLSGARPRASRTSSGRAARGRRSYADMNIFAALHPPPGRDHAAHARRRARRRASRSACCRCRRCRRSTSRPSRCRHRCPARARRRWRRRWRRRSSARSARIAGVTEMTSSSSLGSTRITLQFDLTRDIDGAARDVQAAINAARSLLPTEPAAATRPTARSTRPTRRS